MFKLAAFVISTILATTCADSLPSKNHITGRADFSLASFLLQRTTTASSPSSMQCFTIYLPLLQASSDQWAADYQKCLNTAEDQRNIVLENASQAQKNLSTDAASVCNYIQSCDAISDALTAIDCFSSLSTNTLSTIYTVSNNASDVASVIRQKISNIDTDLYRCTNASERAYVERSARIYDALDECLKYGPPPTVAPPTTTAPTTISTTAPPAEFQDIGLMSVPQIARSSKSLSSESRNGTDLTSLLNAWLQRSKGVASDPKENVLH